MIFGGVFHAARAGALAGVLAGALVGAAQAQAPQPPGQGLENNDEVRILPGDESRARIYEHAVLGYSIAVPAGTRMGERGPRRDLLIQSRRGFDISLQTGETNRTRRLSEMAGRLEDQYLGTGRPWTRKISGAETRIAGLPAYGAVYEGGNTRTRALIVRGAVNDFVFLFRAAPNNFLELEREFQWMLENFIPARNDFAAAAAAPKPAPAPKPAAAQTAKAPEPAPEPAPKPAAPKPTTEPAPEPAPANSGKVFGGKDLGYTIRYPADWTAAKTSDFAAAFSGPPDGDSYPPGVSIQNVRPPGASGPADAAARAALDLRDQLAGQADNLEFIDTGAYVHDYGGVPLKGWQFTVAYDHRSGLRWRQWTVFAPRARGTVVHVWSYAAPDADFDARRPAAEMMLGAWRIGPQ